MFITHITHDDLIQQEGSLELYLGDLPDWEHKIESAKNIVLAKMKNAGRKIRLLNTPLLFKDSTGLSIITTATAFTSEKSDEDTVERMRFVFELTTHTGNSLSVKVQGTNDSESEVYEDVVVLAVDSVGEYSTRILKPFKYYKLTVSASTTRTFKAYLVEDVFFLPVLFKAIALIYLDLKSEPNSNWEDKYKDYEGLFDDAFESLLFSYDSNEDGSLDTSELSVAKKIKIMR